MTSKPQFVPASIYPDSKVHGANMGPFWGQQGPAGPHGGPMNEPCYLGIHNFKMDTLYTLYTTSKTWYMPNPSLNKNLGKEEPLFFSSVQLKQIIDKLKFNVKPDTCQIYS